MEHRLWGGRFSAPNSDEMRRYQDSFRFDLRLAEDGRAYVLEANPNPNLSHGEDFAESAQAWGMKYDALLHRIITLGRSYKAAWRTD